MYNPDKVDDYSKKELAEMIFNGEISQEQVYKDGLFRKHRPFLEDELSLMTQEELDWTEATKKNTIGSYQAYLEKYNPTIVEGETVTDGWGEDTVYIGRHVEDALRLLQATVKKHNDDETENEKDKAEWAKAMNANTIESYLVYISIFDRQPPMYRGQYVDEAKLRINRLQPHETPEPEPAPDPLRNETEDWAASVRVDTIEAYKNYLTKYESIGGKYVDQAKNAIERLLEEKAWSEALDSNDIDGYKKYISTYQNKKGKHLADAKIRRDQLEDDFAWMVATKEDLPSAYKNYLQKYPKGAHVVEARRKLPLPGSPTSRLKYVSMLLFIIFIITFFCWQYQHKKWPFTQKDNPNIQVLIDSITKVDSLQWAIDKKNKPMLIRYAKMDSVRAYLPLAQLLNEEDSAKNINKTLLCLELSDDSLASFLFESIIRDKQSEFYDNFLERVSKVNPNSISAEEQYLGLYKEYVQYQIWYLSQSCFRINKERFLAWNTLIEDIADSYIKDRSKKDVLKNHLYLEWITLKKELSRPVKITIDTLLNRFQKEI